MRKPMHYRLWAAFVLSLIFVRELLLSSIVVARAAFAREVQVWPAIIAVPVDLKTDLGVAMVANLISLTPGTTSLHASPDGSVLYVHCLDGLEDKAIIAGIKANFEHWVREVEG